jgi:hypothetical protein
VLDAGVRWCFVSADNRFFRPERGGARTRRAGG